MPMRGHDDQVATSGLCCFDNRSGRVRIRNMEEFCGYPDLLRHSLSFIEHFACTYLAGCVKAINVFLRGLAFGLGGPRLRNPTTGNAGSCAHPTTGHAAALPSPAMNCRRIHDLPC
jgi:hypothetical protein